MKMRDITTGANSSTADELKRLKSFRDRVDIHHVSDIAYNVMEPEFGTRTQYGGKIEWRMTDWSNIPLTRVTLTTYLCPDVRVLSSDKRSMLLQNRDMLYKIQTHPSTGVNISIASAAVDAIDLLLRNRITSPYVYEAPWQKLYFSKKALQPILSRFEALNEGEVIQLPAILLGNSAEWTAAGYDEDDFRDLCGSWLRSEHNGNVFGDLQHRINALTNTPEVR